MQKPLTDETQTAVLPTLPIDETNSFFREKDWRNTSLGPIEHWPKSLHNAVRILLRAKFPMILFWSGELNFFYNKPFHAHFNRCDHDALGKPAAEALQEGWHNLIEQVRTVMQSGEASLHHHQVSLYSDSGESKTVDLVCTLSPVYDDATPNSLGVLVNCVELATNADVRSAKRKNSAVNSNGSKSSDNELRFNNLLAQSPMAIAILRGEEMMIESANPAIIEVWGKGENIIGKPLLSIMPEIAEQGFPQLLQKVYTTGQPFYGYEMKVVLLRSGAWEDVYFNFVYQPYRESDGSISGIMILATEVTEQVLAKKRVEESENRFSNLIREATVGIVVLTGEEMKVAVVNAAYGRLIGRTPEELEGQSLFDIIPEAEAAYLPVLNKVRLSGEQICLYGQPYFVDNKGERIEGFLNLVYQPYRTGSAEISGVIVLCHDVTEQTLALKKAEESSEKLRIALEGGDLGTFDVYPQIGNMSWSAKTKELFGLPEDTVESFELYSQALHPGDRQVDIATADKAMAGENGGLYENEFRTVGIADGKLRWVRSKGKTSFNKEGKPVRLSGIIQDITRQKEAEDRLRIAQKQLELTIENVPAAVYLFDNTANVLYLNKQGRQHIQNLLGEKYHPSENLQNLLAKSAGKVRYTGENGEPLNAEQYPMNIVLKTGKEASLMMKRIYTESGREEWFLNKVTPLLDEQGKVEFILSTATDYTDQKKSEQKLRESENRFRSLANAMPQIVWVAESNGEVTYYNDRVQAFDGITKLADGNWAWQGMVHPDDIESTAQSWQHAVESKTPYEKEQRIRMKDGGYRWHLSRALPEIDSNGNVVKWYGTATDIHDQKLTEQAIKESENRFRTLAETLPQMIWVSDTDGENEYFSSQWKAFSGKDNPFDAWDSMTHPDDKSPSTQTYRKAFAEGVPFRSEVRLKNSAGEYRWHSSVAEPVKDSTGKIVKWVGALTDIHDQKTIAEKLESVVAERTKELQRSNEDLQQFAHVASHDLKEPVRKVRTFSGRLREELGSSLTGQGQTYLSKIEGAADRMYSMIDGVLAYSSLNAMEQSKERVNLNDVLYDVVVDLELLMHEKEARIHYADLPTIEGIPVLLHQLFYNLVNNSLKFARADVPPQISVHSQIKNDMFIIVVEDNGIGFDQKQAELIFQTFSRLNSKDKYEGTGLGLALCKKIVERHGGTITAQGKESEGARFEVVLPVEGLLIV